MHDVYVMCAGLPNERRRDIGRKRNTEWPETDSTVKGYLFTGYSLGLEMSAVPIRTL